MLGRSLSCRVGSAFALALFANASGWAAPVPVVDTKSTSTSSGVTREQLENLPIGKRLEDLIRTCPSNTIPTVSRQPDVLIDGKPLVDLNCVQPADIEMIEVFKTHNSIRAEYGAPPLAWDPVLVQGPLGAQGYVNIISRTGQLVHASREGRGTIRENISQGLPSWDSMRLMGSWLNERQYFQPGTFPNVSITGDWYQVGHISQMLWPTTASLGCARGVGMGSSWLVCRYDPGGNKDGKTVGIPLQAQQVASAPNSTVRPRLIGGDYLGTTAQQQTASDGGLAGRRPSLFDLGIYAGGAWTSDWFNIQDNDPVIASTNLDEAAPRIADILFSDDATPALNHDYGYDGALFVGYDLGAFRLEAEVPYRQADHELSPPPESLLDDIGDATPPPESLLDDIGDVTPPPAGNPTWTGLLNNVLDTPSLTHPLDTSGYIFLDSDFLSGHGISFIPSSAPLFLSTGSIGGSCAIPTVAELSYLDLVLSFRVGDEYSFRTGADNLLDRDPIVTNGSYQYPNVYDALGRYIFAGCTLDF